MQATTSLGGHVAAHCGVDPEVLEAQQVVPVGHGVPGHVPASETVPLELPLLLPLELPLLLTPEDEPLLLPLELPLLAAPEEEPLLVPLELPLPLPPEDEPPLPDEVPPPSGLTPLVGVLLPQAIQTSVHAAIVAVPSDADTRNLPCVRNCMRRPP